MAEEKGKPLTREDVLKAIEENGGTAKGLDLSGKTFEAGINLCGLNLGGIILNRAIFPIKMGRLLGEPFSYGAQLRGANLTGAQLQSAGLAGADLEKAHLVNANLEAADLSGANLKEADLPSAYLEGASIGGNNITDAHLGEADWGNYKIGEENKKDFRLAEHRYRHLKMWYTESGYYDIAAKFYYREREASRKGARRWNDRLAAEFMRAFLGYGEDWRRVLYWIAGVILGLAVAYYFGGSFTSSSFWDALYYSAVSFTALGYGQWTPQPTGWAKGMGAAEAVIGVFMMALLLVTFVRKWTR